MIQEFNVGVVANLRQRRRGAESKVADARALIRHSIAPYARALTFIAVAVTTLTTAPAGVRAGTYPPPALHVLPRSTTLAPTNTHIVLLFDRRDTEVFELEKGRGCCSIRNSGWVNGRTVGVEVRDAAGASVPVTLRRPRFTVTPVIIVVPKRRLAPHARYAVVVRNNAESFVVAHVNTGKGPDTTAPKVGRVVSARYFVDPSPKDWKDPCGSFAIVKFSSVRGAMAFEIYDMGRASATHPAVLRAVVDDTVGAPAIVGIDGEGPYPRDGRFQFPRVPAGARSYRVRLALRAIDAAGNASALRVITLDLAHPVRLRGRGRASHHGAARHKSSQR